MTEQEDETVDENDFEMSEGIAKISDRLYQDIDPIKNQLEFLSFDDYKRSLIIVNLGRQMSANFEKDISTNVIENERMVNRVKAIELQLHNFWTRNMLNIHANDHLKSVIETGESITFQPLIELELSTMVNNCEICNSENLLYSCSIEPYQSIRFNAKIGEKCRKSLCLAFSVKEFQKKLKSIANIHLNSCWTDKEFERFEQIFKHTTYQTECHAEIVRFLDYVRSLL